MPAGPAATNPETPHRREFYSFPAIPATLKNRPKGNNEVTVLLLQRLELTPELTDIASAAKPTYNFRIACGTFAVTMRTANCLHDPGASVVLIRSSTVHLN